MGAALGFLMKQTLYFLVGLINFGFGAVFYISAKRMALAGANPLLVTATMAAWAAAYAVVSFLVSRIITERNASKILISGGILGTVSGLGFLILQQPMMLYVWMFLLGVAGPLYCAPAQVLIKRVDTSNEGGILRAAGKYTVSWSIGHAVGPFAAGICWQVFPVNGWSIPVVVLTGAFLALIFWGRAIDRFSPPPETGVLPEPDPAYRKYPDLVLYGWILGGAGTLVISLLRAYLPYKTTALDFERFYEGLILALISAAQAVAAYLLSRYGRYWMYLLPKLDVLCLCGILGTALFGFGTNAWVLCAAAVLFGIFSGTFYTYFVFMAMFSPGNSARHLSINEAIVGIVTAAGPLIGGALSLACGIDIPFYLMALLLVPVILTVLAATKHQLGKADLPNDGK